MSANVGADPEFEILAGLSRTIRAGYPEPEADVWAGSPFEWILSRPPASKGKIGRSLVKGWCAAKGFSVEAATGGASMVIQGQRVAVKFSRLWEDGSYAFEQIRDGDYDYLFCLGISPFEVHGWLLPKAVALEHGNPHHGRDDVWLPPFNLASPPDWISGFGGSLQEVFHELATLRRDR